MVDVPDDALKLVTIANDVEAGFAIRYISWLEIRRVSSLPFFLTSEPSG